MARNNKLLAICIFLGILTIVVYIYKIILRPPLQGELKDEHIPFKPEIPVATALERLQLQWDSESTSDWPVSETLATISQTAYLPPIYAEEKYESIGFERIKTFTDASMIGYILSGKGVTVVVFRGTDDKADWLANLNYTTTRTPHGKIHKGFNNVYIELKPQILKILKQVDTKHLWITGHSLGGALAVICAYDLVENEDLKLDGLVTFGQPMVAHEELANYLDETLSSRYARFVNEADMVPRIPPHHTHCGSLVWFTGGGIKRSVGKRAIYGAPGPDNDSTNKNKEGPPTLSEEEFERFQQRIQAHDDVPSTLPDGTPVYGASTPLIDDHSMDRYLEKIRDIHNQE